MTPITCPHCGAALPDVLTAADLGRLGGSKSSPRKTAAVTANSKLPRPGGRKPKAQQNHPNAPKPETLPIQPLPEKIIRFELNTDPLDPFHPFHDVKITSRTKDGLEITE